MITQKNTSVFLSDPEASLNEFKEAIDAVRTHPYGTNPTNYEDFKNFKDAYHKMTDIFWSLRYAFDKPFKYDDTLAYPHIEFMYTSKAAAIYGLANHDLNSTFFYGFRYKDKESKEIIPNFDFKVFFEKSVLPLCDIFENWLNGADDKNPETWSFIEYYRGELRPRAISIYNVKGTSFWKKAIFIRTKEAKAKRLASAKSRLQSVIEEEKRYIEKWGETSISYYKDAKARAENEIKLLTGEITNEESYYLVLDIKE